jgi:uncharacterized protein (DUF305 family)
MHKRHLTVCALLASALVLTACGSGDDTATTGAGTGAANSNTAPADSQGNDADISFLTGMKPHHEQAVEMSDIVLAANPPSEVAALAEQIKGAQAPEIEQMSTMLADLGQPAGGMSHGGGHMAGGHGGMMSDADMAALEAATGTDAARLYLEGMIAHHQGAIEASEAELADGEYEPARALATSIAKEQAAEIATMQDLLASL